MMNIVKHEACKIGMQAVVVSPPPHYSPNNHLMISEISKVYVS